MSVSIIITDHIDIILGAGIIYFLLYLPYTLLVNYDGQTQTWHKVIAVR